MITKVFNSGSANARALTDYVYGKDKKPEVVHSNFCWNAGDKKEFLEDLRFNLNQRPEIAKPVFHAVLSASPNDRISNEKWGEIVKDYMDGMGFGDCAYTAVRHFDRPHPHVHIIGSRIDVGRDLVSNAFDRARSHKMAHELERKYDLQRIDRQRFDGVQRCPERSISQNEYNMQRRLGIPSLLSQIRSELDKADRSKTMGQLAQLLAKQDIKMVPRLTKDQSKIIGVYFEKDGLKISGSKVHKTYSWPNLQKQFEYKKERDFNTVVHGKAPEVKQAPEVKAPQKEASHLNVEQKLEPQQDTSSAAIQPSLEQKIKQGLEQANWDKGYEAWANSLRAKHIEPVLLGTKSDPEKIRGMSFVHGDSDKRVPGSQVHKSYSWKHIQEKLGEYKREDMSAFRRIYIPDKGIQPVEMRQAEPKPVEPPPKVPKKHNLTRQNEGVKAPEKPPVKLIRDRDLGIDKHPALSRLVQKGEPIEIKDKSGQAMKVEDLIRDRQSRGESWSVQARQPGQQLGTLMERDIKTAEGRYSLVVGKEHEVTLVPYSPVLEQARGRDVVYQGASGQAPEIKGMLPRDYDYGTGRIVDGVGRTRHDRNEQDHGSKQSGTPENQPALKAPQEIGGDGHVLSSPQRGNRGSLENQQALGTGGRKVVETAQSKGAGDIAYPRHGGVVGGDVHRGVLVQESTVHDARTSRTDDHGQAISVEAKALEQGPERGAMGADVRRRRQEEQLVSSTRQSPTGRVSNPPGAKEVAQKAPASAQTMPGTGEHPQGLQSGVSGAPERSEKPDLQQARRNFEEARKNISQEDREKALQELKVGAVARHVQEYAKEHGLKIQNGAFGSKQSNQPVRIEGVARVHSVSFLGQQLKVTLIQDDKNIVAMMDSKYKENQKVVLENEASIQQRKEQQKDAEQRVEKELNRLKFGYSKISGRNHHEFETNKAQKIRGEIKLIHKIEGRKFAVVEHASNRDKFSVVELKTEREKCYEVGQEQRFENELSKSKSFSIGR